jgi:hypothetical protein
MRTFLLMLCFWSACTSIAFAQISAGFSTGMNLGWTDHSFLTGLRPTPMLRNMLHIEKRLGSNQRMSVGFEAGVSGQGFQTKLEASNEAGIGLGNARWKQRFQYLDIGSIVKYRLRSGKIRPYVLAAFSSGLLLSGKDKWLFIGSNLPFEDVEQKISFNDYNRRNTFLSGGFGLERDLKNGHLFAECRYQHGLQDVVKPNTASSYFRNVSISIGYAHIFGKKKE